MLRKTIRLPRGLAVALLVGALLLAAISPALALNSFLKTWENTYPDSHTGDANCSVCHGTGNSNLNSYGKSLCDDLDGSVPADITQNLLAIQVLDSDGFGGTNMDEIIAGAQPGWTTGANNQLYVADVGTGCQQVGAPITAPSSIPLPLDPPVGGAPVAIPGGPYTGNVNVPVTFDGSASYDSDGGELTYAWDFGDGTTGEGMTPQHTYAMAGTYTVSLTVTDNDQKSDTASTTATISGAAVLDLDIAAFSVTSSLKLGKSAAIKLTVENPGTVIGQAPATVVGMMGDTQVYKWTLNVYDYNGKGSTSFAFPSYKPTAKGTINWTVTIADVDPDTDQATATTVVK